MNETHSSKEPKFKAFLIVSIDKVIAVLRHMMNSWHLGSINAPAHVHEGIHAEPGLEHLEQEFAVKWRASNDSSILCVNIALC